MSSSLGLHTYTRGRGSPENVSDAPSPRADMVRACNTEKFSERGEHSAARENLASVGSETKKNENKKEETIGGISYVRVVFGPQERGFGSVAKAGNVEAAAADRGQLG